MPIHGYLCQMITEEHSVGDLVSEWELLKTAVRSGPHGMGQFEAFSSRSKTLAAWHWWSA